MNLSDTIEALKLRKVDVILELGEHYNCSLESNCPLAIQLRRMISEAGVTLPELLEAFNEPKPDDPVRLLDSMKEVTAKLDLYLGGDLGSIQVDMSKATKSALQTSILNKLDEISLQQSGLRKIGASLYTAYNKEIQKARNTKVLPQFQASVAELAKYRVTISKSERNNYLFNFFTEYKPLYIYDNGFRYELTDADKKATFRDAILSIEVTPQGSTYFIVLLEDPSGDILRHYHGNTGGDCWGHVDTRLKEFSLAAIDRLKIVCMNSLATINYNSLLNPSPAGMPTAQNVRERAILMGREGETGGANPNTTTARWATAGAGAAWGRRT
jgi:hypothetical protein